MNWMSERFKKKWDQRKSFFADGSDTPASETEPGAVDRRLELELQDELNREEEQRGRFQGNELPPLSLMDGSAEKAIARRRMSPTDKEQMRLLALRKLSRTS